MSLGKHLGLASLVLAFALAAGCSSGGSSSSNTLTAALQDLDLDATGQTTVLTFASSSGLALATVADFECSGGQNATSVTVDGDEVTIVWDARVTPAHLVRAFGLSGVSNAFEAVTTSDPDAPTFTITDGTQNAGLGGDLIEVTFDGANIVEASAEDLSNWTLSIDGTVLDLTGTTLDFDEGTQTLAFTLGLQANLHASFTLAASGVLSVADVAVEDDDVAGTASGDAVAPTLISAEQNLSEDEFGRVIDFTFDEAMDPVFATHLARFSVGLPDVAIAVEQPSEGVLRVTFNNPIVPGVDEVDLNGLMDAHGNVFGDTTQAIAQPAPVANAFDSGQAATLPNADNDYVTAVTDQAFDPDSALDPASWTLVVDGNTIDLSTQTIEYVLTSKTLTITLDINMDNGTAWSLTGVNVLDVDGETFALTFNGTVGGDIAPPAVSSVTQNRTLDESGQTLDVQFNEDVDETTAETLANWSISGAQNLQSATLMPSLDVVRLVFDALVVPGDVTLGADDVADLAGNVIGAPQLGLAIQSTDTADPDLTSVEASAVEGANNDVVHVVFDDDMIESEVETAANWTVESPVGTPLSTVGATIEYDALTSSATLTFSNGVDLRRGDDVLAGLSLARDFAGNVIQNTTLENAVDAETTLPSVHTVYRSTTDTDHLIVGFSEPCGRLDDLYEATLNPAGTRYVLRTSGGTLRGYATGATVLQDGLQVEVAFGVVVANDDTLDVIGVEDLAGNPCFPALALTTEAEDLTEPSLDLGLSVFTAVTGANNDTVTVKFDRPMSPWQLLDAANYTIEQGATTLDLGNAVFSFDGTDTVTIRLASGTGNNLQTGLAYDLTVVDVFSAQGVQRTLAHSEAGIVCGGDSTAPGVQVGRVRIDPSTADSLLIEVNEDVDFTVAETAANYDYDGGNLAVSAVAVGPRTVRATFAVTPTAGNTLQIDVTDLAGNASGSIARTVTAADASGPLVSSVAGTIAPGLGGDTVTITFSEPVDASTALDPANYGVTTGVTVLSLANATLAYTGNTNVVTITLAAGQELRAGAALTVHIQDIEDMAGNVMAAALDVGGVTSGDTTAPAFEASFAHLALDASGATIDVLFSEHVTSSQVLVPASWSATGVTVDEVFLLENDHVRVVLSAAMASNGTLGFSGLTDLAGNAAGAITTNPVE